MESSGLVIGDVCPHSSSSLTTTTDEINLSGEDIKLILEPRDVLILMASPRIDTGMLVMHGQVRLQV